MRGRVAYTQGIFGLLVGAIVVGAVVALAIATGGLVVPVLLATAGAALGIGGTAATILTGAIAGAIIGSTVEEISRLGTNDHNSESHFIQSSSVIEKPVQRNPECIFLAVPNNFKLCGTWTSNQKSTLENILTEWTKDIHKLDAKRNYMVFESTFFNTAQFVFCFYKAPNPLYTNKEAFRSAKPNFIAITHTIYFTFAEQSDNSCSGRNSYINADSGYHPQYHIPNARLIYLCPQYSSLPDYMDRGGISASSQITKYSVVSSELASVIASNAFKQTSSSFIRNIDCPSSTTQTCLPKLLAPRAECFGVFMQMFQLFAGTAGRYKQVIKANHINELYGFDENGKNLLSRKLDLLYRVLSNLVQINHLSFRTKEISYITCVEDSSGTACNDKACTCNSVGCIQKIVVLSEEVGRMVPSCTNQIISTLSGCNIPCSEEVDRCSSTENSVVIDCPGYPIVNIDNTLRTATTPIRLHSSDLKDKYETFMSNNPVGWTGDAAPGITWSNQLNTLNNLKKMKTAIEHGISFRYIDESGGARHSPSLNAIVISKTFLTESKLYSNLAHEISHLAFHTSDYTYEPSKCKEYADLLPIHNECDKENEHRRPIEFASMCIAKCNELFLAGALDAFHFED